MSDYLWDKSGEPDGDVERLEALLGRLRHAGAAPELPFGVESHAPTRARVFGASGILRPARLAAAAALLLAILAGAFVMLRTFKTDGGRASADKETQVTRPQPNAPEEVRPREESAPQVAASPSKESVIPERLHREPSRRDAVAVATPSPKSPRREPAQRETIASEPSRRDVKPVMSRGGILEGSAPDVDSRVRAKEQLVYALRLTSEALKQVRGRASGVEVHPNAFDGRSPLR